MLFIANNNFLWPMCWITEKNYNRKQYSVFRYPLRIRGINQIKINKQIEYLNKI